MISGCKSELIGHLTGAYRYGLVESYTRLALLGSVSFVVIDIPTQMKQ